MQKRAWAGMVMGQKIVRVSCGVGGRILGFVRCGRSVAFQMLEVSSSNCLTHQAHRSQKAAVNVKRRSSFRWAPPNRTH